jgi:hypothetical protein
MNKNAESQTNKKYIKLSKVMNRKFISHSNGILKKYDIK